MGINKMFIMSCDAGSNTFQLGVPSDITVSASPNVTSAQIVTALANFTTWLNRAGDTSAAMGDGQSGTFTP